MGPMARVEELWVDRGLPRAVDVILADRIVGGWRSAAVGAAEGRVLEFGFGSGANLRFYGESVKEVLAVDPSDLAWRAAQPGIARFGRPVTRIGDDAALIDLPDESVDTVVATWTLCSIADVEDALAEARRVLRPGGSFRLVEHSLSPRPSVQRFQRRVQPVWGRVSGGCHIDRDMSGLLASAGFDTGALTARDAFQFLPAKPWSYFVAGGATPC
ncbi:MAG TPA: class I SAM-dependent methyltransferase [Propionibacterium sp.]|nr:class I SAM-dependent methyltransferase [Propionibacterium sp.]